MTVTGQQWSFRNGLLQPASNSLRDSNTSANSPIDRTPPTFAVITRGKVNAPI